MQLHTLVTGITATVNQSNESVSDVCIGTGDSGLQQAVDEAASVGAAVYQKVAHDLKPINSKAYNKHIYGSRGQS